MVQPLRCRYLMDLCHLVLVIIFRELILKQKNINQANRLLSVGMEIVHLPATVPSITRFDNIMQSLSLHNNNTQ